MKKVLIMLLASPAVVFAESTWTPLVTSTSFDGIKADVGTCVAGIISVLLIIAGVGMIMRIMR